MNENENKQKIKRFIKSNKNLFMFSKRLQMKCVINKVSKRIKGKNNNIKASKRSILKKVVVDIKGSNNYIEIEDGCILNKVTFYIRGNGHRIILKENVVFTRGGEIWFEDNNGYLIIGENTTIENAHIAVTEDNSSIIIGNDCMLSYDIDIRTGDSHTIIDLNNNKRINYADNIKIGNHVWIGAHCTLLKGSLVNDNSVIGTGSILTKKIDEKNVILTGIPAKISKRNINWCRERI